MLRFGILNNFQAVLESNQRVSEMQAYKAVTQDLEKLLGVRAVEEDLVVFAGGGMWDIESKVLGIVSSTRKTVDLF